MSARKQGQIAREKKYIINVNNTLDIQENNTIRDLVPTTSESSDLGSYSNYWRNAYIQDISARNISVSGNIVPFINLSGSLGTTDNIWQKAFISDLSGISSINGMNWSSIISGGGGTGGGTSDFNGTDITTDLIPRNPISVDLGTTSKYWRNAYITNISASNISVSGNIIFNVSGGSMKIAADASNNSITTTHRVYQEISGDISWSAVNGYYALAKDAYPALNPYSSGAKALSKWTNRTTYANDSSSWTSICWSPKLEIFVAVASEGTKRVMTSKNGIVWSTADLSNNNTKLTSVCWSPQLEIFVAVFENNTTDTTANKVVTSSNGTLWIERGDGVIVNNWTSICWSAELSLFVAVANAGSNNRVMYSSNGINWNSITSGVNNNNLWNSICWSPELGLFAAIAYSFGSGSDSVMTSSNGKDWTSLFVPNITVFAICWSAQLGIFVAVGNFNTNRVMISSDGKNWITRPALNATWTSVCWSATLGIFVATSNASVLMIYSYDGLNWILAPNVAYQHWKSICWSPELGIFAAVGYLTGSGYTYRKVMTSSLQGRPPTSYNVFDSRFNSIDESGNWTFSNISVSGNIIPLFPNTGSIGLDTKQWGNIHTVALKVDGVSVSSDDRKKHNEVIITNGLTIINQLTPKFYQKTLEMLDARYNGDLTGYVWNYESGLIAQELLHINDLSFVVSDGDYYDSNNVLIEKQYSVNYNSIFVYGLAAIKELDVKVKNQESIINSLLTIIEALDVKVKNQESIINSLLTRIEALENKP